METLIGLVVVIIPLWKICARAGFNPVLSLIAIIPFFGLVVVVGILAFLKWPSLKPSVIEEK